MSLKTAVDYADFVEKLFKKMDNHTEYLVHAAMGISGEAGEIIDAVKKKWVYNKLLDEANLKEELGDILFYIQAMANFLPCTIEELMLANMEKLKKRYPEGYTDKAAQERKDKQ